MALLELTTYAEVRAALGVNDIEISDTTLGLELYSSNLSMELDDINIQLQDKYAEVKAIDAAARSAAQKRFYEAVRLFATYTVAKHCCVSLPMFGPKSVSDSKTEVSRFSDSPYKETTKRVENQYSTVRQRVVAALDSLLASTTVKASLNVMMVSTPSSDPVTG